MVPPFFFSPSVISANYICTAFYEISYRKLNSEHNKYSNNNNTLSFTTKIETNIFFCLCFLPL